MPPIKVKLELQTCGGLLNSKLPRPITIVGQLEIGISSQIVFITLFFGSCYGMPFTSLSRNCAKMLSQNHFALLSQTRMFDFFLIEFEFPGSHTEHRWSCS